MSFAPARSLCVYFFVSLACLFSFSNIVRLYSFSLVPKSDKYYGSAGVSCLRREKKSQSMESD